MSTDDNESKLPPQSQASRRVLNREVFYAGKDIIRQGDDGFRAYYMEDGQAEVLVHDGVHELRVATLGPGDIFGEMALISDEPRSATIRAVKDCTVAVLSNDELKKKMKDVGDPAITSLLFSLVERLRQSTQGQMKQYKNLADFQDRLTGILDRAQLGIDKSKREQFREEIIPVLETLERILDKYS